MPRLLLAVLVAACLSAAAHAHFVLIMPAASMVQNGLGDPQKIAPCGGVSANPERDRPANPGVPSGAVTSVQGGARLPLMVQESIFHPGHYRVALARTADALPPDPEVTIGDTGRGLRSVAATIQDPPVAPVLLDGIFPHDEPPMRNWEIEVPLPNIDCEGCVLQVIQVMLDHPGIAIDGGHSYHHCAVLDIQADPSLPVDTWP